MNEHQKEFKQLEQAQKDAETVAKEASVGKNMRSHSDGSMYSHGGAHAQGGGVEDVSLRADSGKELKMAEYWSRGGMTQQNQPYGAGRRTEFEGSVAQETSSGQATYNATVERRNGNITGGVSVKRYDSAGNEVYSHESMDPRFATKVGIVAAHGIEQEAKQKTAEQTKAA